MSSPQTPTTLYRHPLDQRGSVLLMALLVTLIILGIGLTAMWLSSSGTQVAGNITRKQEALYAAETGIARARAVLSSNGDWTALLGSAGGAGCTPAATKDSTRHGNVLCDSAVGNIPLQDVRVIEAGSATAGVTNLANVRYTVWIRNDPQEINLGDAGGFAPDGGGALAGPYTDLDQRVIVRAEGVARDGLSIVVLEAVISRAPGTGVTTVTNIQSGVDQFGSGGATVSGQNL